MSGAYPQPYRHDSHAAPYPPAPYHYAAPPPPPPSGRQEGYQGHNQRGRGGHRGRGRGGNNHGDRSRHHNKGQSDHHGQQGKQHSQQQQQPQSQQQQQNKHKNQEQAAGKKKKRKTNTLGLTPGVDSETEDDEEEEQTLATLLGPETFVPDDIATYIAQRKKNFPTKARVEAKKADAKVARKEDKTSELQKQADKLRRQLRKVESSIKRKREQGDEGDEMRDPAASDEDDSSDDGAPEVLSSRATGGATLPNPPTASTKASAKKADISRHCKYYSTGGTCGKKSKCRFVHDPEVREAAVREREANNGRLTIQQRLILNDKEQEDLAVLESIQYLRGKGIMNEVKKPAPAAASPTTEQDGAKPSATTSPVPKPATSPTPPAPKDSPPSVSKTSILKKPGAGSSLPAKPPSLPPIPIKREYPSSSVSPASSLPRRSGSHHSTASSKTLGHGSTAASAPQQQEQQAAATAEGQPQQPYEGWLPQPYGSSVGGDTKSDDLP